MCLQLADKERFNISTSALSSSDNEVTAESTDRAILIQLCVSPKDDNSKSEIQIEIISVLVMLQIYLSTH